MTRPQQPGFAIGVDLGTSNTVAVIGRADGQVRQLNFDGAPILPSGVFVDESGVIHVGRDAQRLALTDPARFEPNPKRRIDEGTVLLGSHEVPVPRLLAATLRTVADKAVETVGFLPPAVLAYPAAWGSVRQGVLVEAVRQAGWPPVRLTPEPVAAARYFAQVLRRPVPVGAALAVFDFGGGTLDVAVVRHEPDGGFAVIAAGGEENLGGLDLDAALVDHVGGLIDARHPEIWQHLSRPRSTADHRYRRMLWEDVRGAKEMLSRSTAAPIAIPGVDHSVHLTREEMERLTDPLLRRAVLVTEKTVRRAGLRPEQLSGLFLVGGSSRVPLVARLLHAQLGVAPTVLEQPEFPVAEGALTELLLPPSPPVPVGAVPVPPEPATAPPPPPPPPAPMPWYRKTHLLVPIAAAVVVLAVLGGFALFYNPHTEKPFGDLTQVSATPLGVDSPSDTWYQLDGDTAVTAVTSSSGSGSSSRSRILVKAWPLGDKKAKPNWTPKPIDSPNGGEWGDGIQVVDGLIVLQYADAFDDKANTVPGGVVVLDERTGARRWASHAGNASNDWWTVMRGSGVLLHYHADTEKPSVTAYDLRAKGHLLWSKDGFTDVYLDRDYQAYSGPAGFADASNTAPPSLHSTTLVLATDSVATLFDARSGKKGDSHGISVGTRFVYDGVLYVASDQDPYDITAYDLDDFGSSKWSKAAEAGWKLGSLVVCGKQRLCASEYRKGPDDSGKAPSGERVRLIDTVDGTNTVKPLNLKNNHNAVPVGDRFMVSYKDDGDLQTQVYDDNGKLGGHWVGESARLDNATVLTVANDILGLDGANVANDPATGLTLIGYGVYSLQQKTLGIVAADLRQCTWNDRYLFCVADDAQNNDQFVVSSFRDSDS